MNYRWLKLPTTIGLMLIALLLSLGLVALGSAWALPTAGPNHVWYHLFEMAQPKPTSDPVVVPEALKPLVEQLAKLLPRERDLVVRAAEGSQQRYNAVSWELLEAARGVVSFGGDAVEDSKSLYDG